MQKISVITLQVAAIGVLTLGSLRAQDTAPAKAQSAPAPAPAPKTQKTPATKPHASTGTGATGARTSTPLVLKTQKDKLSYAIGLNIGKSLHKDAVEVDPAIFARGVKDALTGAKALLTDEELKTVLTTLQGELQKRQEETMRQAGEINKKAGDAFLAENKTKPGVVTLPSGLQYKILTEGTGPKPAATDSVVCNYRGTLIDGTEFDSSYKRGQPATFPVNGVIKGWTEAVQLMPVGSKWQLFVPAELAYGNRGAGPTIGPDATLIFEVELLSIQDKTKSNESRNP
jgi:FKBP-type peptidyl-prolyl cis-trans isomerase FklB